MHFTLLAMTVCYIRAQTFQFHFVLDGIVMQPGSYRLTPLKNNWDRRFSWRTDWMSTFLKTIIFKSLVINKGVFIVISSSVVFKKRRSELGPSGNIQPWAAYREPRGHTGRDTQKHKPTFLFSSVLFHMYFLKKKKS